MSRNPAIATTTVAGPDPLRSRLYLGSVWHERLGEVHHEFSYPVYTWCIDLDELPALERALGGLFGHNKSRPFSLRDADYLSPGPEPVREKLASLLEKRGVPGPFGRVELITSPRFFGYVFNPVSFYRVWRPDGSLACHVAEVNNTFGEKHVYVLTDWRTAPDGTHRVDRAKEFHVSPFYRVEGEYAFAFSAPDRTDRLDVRINMRKDGRLAFLSRLAGEAAPLTQNSLWRTLVRYPLNSSLTMPRILAQAAKLYYGKRVRHFTKPVPASPDTIRVAPPTLAERISMNLVLKFLGKIRNGCMVVTLPDGERRVFGDPESTLRGRMNIREYACFPRLARDGDIGLGETYTAGLWDSEDPTALLRVFLANNENADDRDAWFSRIGRAINRWRHTRRANTPRNSQRNIREHYDLGNDMFSAFLDESMMYSCAYWEHPEDSLAEAQRAKLQRVIRMAQLGPDDHVLEIGCGWGAFAIEAVKTTGCRVTGISLSKEQLEWARRRVKEEGLEDRITLLHIDYRHMTGSFTKIVSIEMIEAVGHQFYPSFFQSLERLLAPDGLVVIQAITYPDSKWAAYRDGVDWIQKHIFPGGELPSLTALSEAMTRHSKFMIEHVDNIGVHYARTLREWRSRFLAAREHLKRNGYGDEFVRAWDYYFCYCEAGFESRAIATHQIVFTRPQNRRLPNSPEVRSECSSPLK